MVPRIPGSTEKGINSVRAGSIPAFGSLYMARVPEWSKGEACKAFIRKFESCPVLQFVSYNSGAKTNRISFCPSLKEPSLRGLFGGYHRGLGYNEII